MAIGLVGVGVRVLPAVVAPDTLLALPSVVSANAPMTSPAAPPSSTPTPRSTASAQGQASDDGADKTAAVKKGSVEKKAPATVTVPAAGPGTYNQAEVNVESASSAGRLLRYDVRVEKGLDLDAKKTALLIESVLNDKRSWRGTGRWRFELVAAGEPADLHAYIVTPATTDKLCAPLLTRGEVSCQNGNRVVLNAKRWMLGVSYYGDDLTNYRRYLVNHEFGHALGHSHVQCPGRGQPAPVMMQQTKGLDGCRKNPWPMTNGD
ncbi:MAG TPA: DUF3152 domain-containing protein [Propionibacteriaceae bacterium]